MMKYLQKLGKALMLPVAVLPICGILMVTEDFSRCRVLLPKQRRHLITRWMHLL